MDNFDLKKYLVENKITANSKLLNEALTAGQVFKKLENMGFNEDLLAYTVQDGKVVPTYGQDRMIFDHYGNYLDELVATNGEVVSISKYQGTLPSVGGLKPDLKAEITFKSGDKLIIAQDSTSEIPEFDDKGNLAGDQSSENSMDVTKLGNKFFTLSNRVDLIPTEKWLQSRNIPTSKKKAAANAETFTEFEEILRADSPLIFTFETGDDYVETVYVYDLGDGNVAMVDDYVDGYSIHPKAAFEKFKEVLKQASGKTEA
jgi:hypothetical protein